MGRPELVMERAVLLKTGRLARRFDAYPLPYLQAMLLFGDEASAELSRIARGSGDADDLDWLFQDVMGEPSTKRRRVQGPPTRRKRLPPATSYDEPVFTGDPVADEWERAIARGEIPDFDAHPPKPMRRR